MNQYKSANQQSGPETALARDGKLMPRSTTPCFGGNSCSLPIFALSPLQDHCGEPSCHDLAASSLGHTLKFWFWVLSA